jgi:hypothetical protein
MLAHMKQDFWAHKVLIKRKNSNKFNIQYQETSLKVGTHF